MDGLTAARSEPQVRALPDEPAIEGVELAPRKAAPKWTEVAADPRTKALSDVEYDALRRGFFTRVIAPRIGGEERAAAWTVFESRTRRATGLERAGQGRAVANGPVEEELASAPATEGVDLTPSQAAPAPDALQSPPAASPAAASQRTTSAPAAAPAQPPAAQQPVLGVAPLQPRRSLPSAAREPSASVPEDLLAGLRGRRDRAAVAKDATFTVRAPEVDRLHAWLSSLSPEQLKQELTREGADGDVLRSIAKGGGSWGKGIGAAAEKPKPTFTQRMGEATTSMGLLGLMGGQQHIKDDLISEFAERSPSAPVNRKEYERFQQANDLMSQKDRDELKARPDWLGNVFKRIEQDDAKAEQAGKEDSVQGRIAEQGLSQGTGAGKRLKDRVERLKRENPEIKPEVAENIAKADIAYGMPTRNQGSVVPSEREPEAKGAERLWRDYQAGVVGSTGAMLSHTGRKIGFDSMSDLGRAMDEWAEGKMPAEPTFADTLVNAIGSSVSFFVPGIGVMKGTQALAVMSPLAAKWAGAGAMSFLEAAAEADGVYQARLKMGDTEKAAAEAADKSFWSNMALLGVTNKLAFFGDAKKLAPRVLGAAAAEGPGQELPQQVIQNYLTGQPLFTGGLEAAVIGAIVGGGMSAGHAAVERVGGAEEASPRQEPMRTPPRPGQAVPAEPRMGAQPADVGGPPEPVLRVPAQARGIDDTVGPQPMIVAGAEPAERPGRVEPVVPDVEAPAVEVEGTAPPPLTRSRSEPSMSGDNEPAITAGQPLRIGGLSITIEGTAGSPRTGRAPTSDLREVTPQSHFGYISRPGGDQVDVLVVPGTRGAHQGPVYLVDQISPATGQFTESLAVIGAASPTDARSRYLELATAAPESVGEITEMPMAQFGEWVREADPAQPAAQWVRSQPAQGVEALSRERRGTEERALPREALRTRTNERAREQEAAASPRFGAAHPRATDQPPPEAKAGSSSGSSRIPQGTAALASALERDQLVTERARILDLLSRPSSGSASAQAAGPGAELMEGRKGEQHQADVPDTPGGAERRRQLVERWWNDPDFHARVDRAADEYRRQPGRLAAILSEFQDILHGDQAEAKSRSAGAERGPEAPRARSRLARRRARGAQQQAQARPAPATRAQPQGSEVAAPAVLGAQGVGRRAYEPPTSPETKATARGRPDAIREAIRRLLNVPISEKGVTVRRAAGIYKTGPRTIRLRNQADMDTLSHEAGHHLSATTAVRSLMDAHSAELLGLTPEAYAKEPVALRREEGFAEFGRLYLTQRSQAKAQAPKFFEAFQEWLKTQEATRKALDEIHDAVEDWFALNPSERILAKVGARPQSWRERVRNLFDLDRAIFEVLDNWHPLRLMVKDLDPSIAAGRDPFKAAHLLSGDAALIEDWLTSGTAPYDYARRADPSGYGKPLAEILKPVVRQLREFSAYLIARRAKELKAKGKERLFTEEEIRAGLSLETEQFKATAKEIYAYNDQLLDYAVEGGLLAPEVAEKFREYEAYIPFFREQEDTGGSRLLRRRGNPFKRLRGGTANLRDPIANIIENTATIIHATNRNAVLAKAYELAKSIPGGGRWVEEVPLPRKALQVSTDRMIAELKRQGVEIDTSMAEDLATIQTFWQRNPVGDDRTRTMIAKIDGEPVAIQVNDDLLWQAFQAFEPIELGLVGKMLAVPSDLLRAGVTLSPDFMARNFMRDTLSGFMQSQTGMLPIIGTVGGFKEVATRSDAAKLFRAFGGAYADMWQGESEQTRNTLIRMAKHGKFPAWSILTPSGVLSLLRHLGSISEAGTRVAEFKRTAEEGDADSLIDAAFNAREVSVDFGVHGHNRNIRLLTRITPFLNPALQGLHKSVRTVRGAPLRTLLRGSVLTLVSVLLYLLNRDEDWYQDLEDWERNVYWHLDVGLRTDEGDVVPVRIPKPFEWGAVFGSIPEAIAELGIERYGKAFGKRLGSILEDIFALRAVPTAVLVPAEIWANKSTFTDRPIVPDSLERLDPGMQYGPHTSLTARAAGGMAGVSPAQIDHAVRGFLGTLGVYGVMLADQGLRAAGDYPRPPRQTWRQIPVVKAFTHDPDSPHSRAVNEFYEYLGKVRRAEASYGQLQGDEADAYHERHNELIDDKRSAERVARDLAKLRKENREIIEDRDYTPDEKRELLLANNRAIKALSREFIQERQDDALERAR